jgi:hypothetical protein
MNPITPSTELPSLKDAQKELQRELQKLFKSVCTLIDYKAGDPDFPAAAVKVLTELPKGEVLGESLELLKNKFSPQFESFVQANIQVYKRYETAYLRGLKERGGTFRETSNGWRIGPLMLETKPALAQARFLYNRQTLTDWTDIRDENKLVELEQQASELLKLVELEGDELTEWVWICFKKAIIERYESIEGQRCLIQDVYLEFEARMKRDTAWRKKLGTMTKERYPMWAFLYNLDRYRTLGTKVPASRRLMLQTGSQQEVSQGLGVTVGGLVTEDDYKTMCYLIRLGG